ncbi:phenolic glucoside malonyltransferase 2-like [Aristolochia californica]|uniref:phenolic glucoside malonyltransferase 2-like n=1 Tax=Aristolochia californica TaxID=171875 RepID=UPI0035DD5980
MAATTSAVKELQRLCVSPPPGSVASATIELSFFDVIWLIVHPVKRLFFFHLPVSTDDFRDSHFPALTEALSLALKIFYPLAGTLTHSPDDPDDPIICYVDGDSVPLTLAESNGDFARLSGDQMRDVEELHPLVPALPEQEDPERKPLLALQVTLFPGSGVCIGITVHHSVADGSSSIRFMKSWASIFKAGGDTTVVKPLPSFDRSVVGELQQLRRDFLDYIKRIEIPESSNNPVAERVPVGRVVLATFVLTRFQIQKLRDLVSSGGRDVGPRPSTFVLTLTYTWLCLIKARGLSERKSVYCGFAADFRTRLRPQVPDTFFGNCIGAIFAEGRTTDLTRGDGLAAGSEVIQRAIREVADEPMRDAGFWIHKFINLRSERLVSVAGSPRIRVYETDFGWGAPRKVEIMSILDGGAISLAESRDEPGGVEIGLGGLQPEVELFASFFEEGLRCP